MRIAITNLTTATIDEESLQGVAQKVVTGENREEEGVSIVLIGQGRMRKLNKKYRQKNRVTDVLAFPTGTAQFIIPSKEARGLGEIVICLREVKKNANKFGSSFQEELARILIHGILHLVGYDHERSEQEAEQMQEKQDYYLSQVL